MAKTDSCKYVIVIIYVTAFLFLACYGLWDVSKIIDDYINNNKMVTIQKQNITDRFPFLDKIQICLDYSVHLFPGQVDEFAFRKIVKNRWLRTDIPWERNMSKSEKSVAIGTLDLLFSYFAIGGLDDDGPNGDGVNLTMNRFNFTKTELFSIMDEFLMNPDNVNLTETAWLESQKMLISTLYGPGAFTISEIVGTRKICISVPLGDELLVSLTDSTKGYLADSKYVPNTSITELPRGGPYRTILLSKYDAIKVDNDAEYTSTVITLSNNGVFNSTSFPPCSKNFETEEDCIKNVKIKAVSDVCNCIQFSKYLLKV